MTKAIVHAYNWADEYGIKLTYAFFIISGLLIALYGFNIYSIISNTVAIESLQKKATELTSKVDSLDSQYLALSNDIVPDNLKKYGLSQTKVSLYISRSASLGSVAVGGNEL